MTPKFTCLIFFAYEYPKNVEFYAGFKSVLIIRKKCTQKKLFAKNFSETVTEGNKHSTMLNYFGLQLFCCQFYRIFLNVFRIRMKFCIILIPNFQF
jgi:hypothetical protein